MVNVGVAVDQQSSQLAQVEAGNSGGKGLVNSKVGHGHDVHDGQQVGVGPLAIGAKVVGMGVPRALDCLDCIVQSVVYGLLVLRR